MTTHTSGFDDPPNASMVMATGSGGSLTADDSDGNAHWLSSRHLGVREFGTLDGECRHTLPDLVERGQQVQMEPCDSPRCVISTGAISGAVVCV